MFIFTFNIVNLKLYKFKKNYIHIHTYILNFLRFFRPQRIVQTFFLHKTQTKSNGSILVAVGRIRVFFVFSIQLLSQIPSSTDSSTTFDLTSPSTSLKFNSFPTFLLSYYWPCLKVFFSKSIKVSASYSFFPSSVVHVPTNLIWFIVSRLK